MKKRLIVYVSIIAIVFLSIISIFSYAYISATRNSNNVAIVNTQLPNGSYSFTVSDTGTLTQTFNANKMLASASSTTAISSNSVNLKVSLKSPDSTSRVTCTYDLIWEWTGSDKYTESDTSLPFTSGSTYKYEYSVQAGSSTTGSPSGVDYRYTNSLNETDLSKFTWNGSKAVIHAGATIISSNPTTATVTTWTITTKIYNIPTSQTKLMDKEFKAKIYVDNVNCDIYDTTSKPTVLSGNLNTIGSEVTIGNEHFYVLGNDTDTSNVKLLAKYNLWVGNNYNVSPTTCTESGHTWYTANDTCSVELDIITASDKNYNMQSSKARGWYCEKYAIFGQSSEVITTFNTPADMYAAIKGLTSTQKSNMKNINCYVEDGYYEPKRATVAFDSEYDSTSYGYWTSSLSPYSLLSEYGTSYPTWIYNDNATIKSYVDNYESILENRYGVSVNSARLIKLEKVTSLGCNTENGTCLTDEFINNNRTWLLNTSFWTGTAYNNVSVRRISDIGVLGANQFYADDRRGLRPLIIVPKSIFS